MSGQVQIGRHLFAVEPPDVIRVVLHGDLSAEELRETLTFERILAAESGRVLLMLDASDLGHVGSEARKAINETTDIPFRGYAVYGASFHARLIFNMMILVRKLLMKGEEVPAIFCATEAEARRWIEARRVALDGGERIR
ncbi:Hypothetical protein CAP_8337 [Chondromyces apiculatus DSM 436]|uniref:STAS/SEC14 domain-containing protein n=1 Tax=Chondromyces apiculatus DSM 436 TaxID=1192034 RepID=A0A017SYL7_9BACT|nr:Hypothetical protein CAP_8337 [Chondromyces apiculatus DSM 436]